MSYVIFTNFGVQHSKILIYGNEVRKVSLPTGKSSNNNTDTETTAASSALTTYSKMT